MKHETYHLLRQAYLGHVNKHALIQSVIREKDPFLHRAVQLVTQETSPRRIPWNSQIFTTEFRNGNPQERLEETVMTYLLRLAALVKEEIHVRSFQKPESHAAVHAWINLFKLNLYAVLSLLFKVHWEEQNFFELEKVVFDLIHEGKASALRHFMEHDLKIKLSTTTTMAEERYENLHFLNIGQFGSSFWRLLHWMAEAMDIRNDPRMNRAKQFWRDLITGPLYRTLRCAICKKHMRKFTQELETQLMDPNTQYSPLWYNIHNKVSASKMEVYLSLGINMPSTTYSESEFEQDVAFMRQALAP